MGIDRDYKLSVTYFYNFGTKGVCFVNHVTYLYIGRRPLYRWNE